MGARPAPDQPGERLAHRLEEGLGQAARRHRTEGIAVEPRVLGGDPALLAADPHGRRPALGAELLQHALGGHGLERALLRLGAAQVADRPQHVVERVGVGRSRSIAAALEVGLDVRQGIGVDQLAELLLAEELAQKVAVER